MHTVIVVFLLALAFTLPFYMFAPQLFTFAGAGKATGLAVSYARIIFLGSVTVFFSNAANSILRSEGDSKRAMKAMVLGAVLNIVLDPIFIYGLDMGIATAVLSVSGAAIGSGDYIKAKIALSYSTKLGFLKECGAGILIFVFATQIASVFTQTESGAHITEDLAHFLRVMCLFYPVVALWIFSSSFFQGAGRGINALVATLLRTIVFTPFFAVLFAFALDLGQVGAWWGMVAGNGIGSLLLFLWATYFLRGLLRIEHIRRAEGLAA